MIKVNTIYGEIFGEKRSGYISFKGIPYAKPPVGELRFRPPQDPESWSGIRDCTSYGAPALQLFTSNHITQPQILRSSSEDCLYLNVKTPAVTIEKDGYETVDAKASLPVYVFIHGGAYETGGSNLPLYAGENFAKKGVVYVNINYRLNIFASMALKTLEAESGITGNYQILDMIKALEWVHDNIKAFGGDPENVTVGGESAGAFSVSVLMGMPRLKGLFRRCILESGSIIGTAMSSRFGKGNPEFMINNCREFINELGASDTPEGLRLLRSLPAEKLINRWFFRQDGSYRGLKSDPLLKNLLFDDDLMPDPRTQPLNNVDLLFGFNSDEGTMFADRNINEAGYELFLRGCFGNEYRKVQELYPVNAEHSPYERMADIIGLQSFKGSMIPYADVLSERGMSVYGYHFDYLPDGLKAEGLGCRHIAELNFVFGKFLVMLGADTEEGRSVSEFMNDAWVNFIKTGNPNSKNVADTEQESVGVLRSDSRFDVKKICWQPYSTENRNMMKINAEHKNVPLERADEMAFFEEILKKK